MAFFGDGAPAQGAFHEAVNLAAVWQLPVVFFCENNGYAEFSPASTQHAATLEQRAAGYGVDYVAVDGNDVVATAGGHGRRRGSAVRAGRGPVIVEAATYRWHGHYEGDPERYRSPEEVKEWEGRDPLPAHERRLRDAGIADDEIKALESTVADELDGAVEAARRLDEPAASTLGDFVVRARPPVPEPAPPPADAPVFRTMDAIRTALEAELAADERVFVAGIDVGAGGNVFGLTRGLHDAVRRPGARHADLRDGDRRPRRRRGHGRHAPGRRGDVPRLPRRLLRPAAQPGGQAAVHDRRRRPDGPDRAHPVRRRPLVGQPALAEPRGAAGAHPGPDAW